MTVTAPPCRTVLQAGFAAASVAVVANACGKNEKDQAEESPIRGIISRKLIYNQIFKLALCLVDRTMILKVLQSPPPAGRIRNPFGGRGAKKARIFSRFQSSRSWPSEAIPLGHSGLALLNFSGQGSCRLQLSGYCTCASHLPLTQRGRPWSGSRSPWHRDPCGAR
jgi:hypothetical protein